MNRLWSLWLFDWRKVLVYTHRWLGIAGCVLFVAWFVSGVVMMYARMPGLANEERLARAPALDLSTVTVSPPDAAIQLDIRADRLQIGMFGRRPVYRFGAGRAQTIVFADTATIFEGISRDEALEVARRYAPHHTGPVRYDRYVTEPDQWTLQARGLMPMHRFALDDAADTHLYVSEVSGDVVLRTTRRERFWSYLGPVTHWVCPFMGHPDQLPLIARGRIRGKHIKSQGELSSEADTGNPEALFEQVARLAVVRGFSSAQLGRPEGPHYGEANFATLFEADGSPHRFLV